MSQLSLNRSATHQRLALLRWPVVLPWSASHELPAPPTPSATTTHTSEATVLAPKFYRHRLRLPRLLRLAPVFRSAHRIAVWSTRPTTSQAKRSAGPTNTTQAYSGPAATPGPASAGTAGNVGSGSADAALSSGTDEAIMDRATTALESCTSATTAERITISATTSRRMPCTVLELEDL